MKRLFNPLMAAALVVLASACQKVERIEVKPPSVALTEAGQTATLAAVGVTAEGKPVEGTKFEYASSDEKVAKVDATGKVTAVKSGTASVTIKAGEKSTKVPVDVSIPSSIAIKGAPFTLTGLGSTAVLEGQVQDDAGRPVQEAKLEYAVADAHIITVSGNTLQAKGVGTTSVVATSGKLEQRFEVTVKLPEVAAVAFDTVPAGLKVGESTSLVVVAKGTDGAAINGVPIAFTSSNDKIATVDATGKVTAVKAGAVTITAQGADKTVETKLTIKK